MRLVLASASPRRSELLAAAGVSYIVDAIPVDETPLDGEMPDAYVARLAIAKARAVLARHSGDVVLGADTTVVLDGEIFGKPADDTEATAMLRRLSGRTHDVFTGIGLVTAEGERARVERTAVVMSPLDEEEIAWYVASGEPRDRAGAYAIQGLASRFITRIEGSFSTVVGLPVAAVLQLLKEMGLAEVASGAIGPYSDRGSAGGTRHHR